MAEKVLDEHKTKVASFELKPSSGGVFELTVEGALLFSKKSLGRFPEDGEAEELIRGRVKSAS